MTNTPRPVDFDIDALLARAQEKSGLSDFGSHEFREGLQCLMTTYDQNYTDQKARKKLYNRLRDLLMTRLRIEAAFKRHPEIYDEKITRPVYLTGLPRTGTSALLNLMAVDKAARPLKLWEGLNPDPLEGLEPGADDPRHMGMRAFYEQMNEDPEFSKIHHTTADTPEECIHLLNHSFEDVQFGIEPLMEPYYSWFQQSDHRPSYDYYADILRMLQWQRPGDRWLLKSPCHLWVLDTLVDMFPDCCIVITHRNPLECVTSYASMMTSMMDGRDVDGKEVGPVVLEYLAKKLEVSLEARKHFSEERVIDIQFNDFISDSLGTVHKIYDHFQLPMSEQTAADMKAYSKEHPMGKHGSHDYQLEQYGLTEAKILDRFGFYIDRFNIPMD